MTIPKSKSYAPTKGRCTCLQQYSHNGQTQFCHSEILKRNPITPFGRLWDHSRALYKVYGRVQAPWEMNQVFTYRTHYHLRAIVHLRTWISCMEKKLDMIPKLVWEISGIPYRLTMSGSSSAAPRSECLYDLTSAFKELEIHEGASKINV